MRIIYAISPDGRDSLSYHTPFNRGTRSIYLRRNFVVNSNIPEDTFNVDIVVDKVGITVELFSLIM